MRRILSRFVTSFYNHFITPTSIISKRNEDDITLEIVVIIKLCFNVKLISLF